MKRKAQSHWDAFLADCQDPLSVYDSAPPRTSISFFDSSGRMTGFACGRRRIEPVEDHRGPFARFVGMFLNLRKYGSLRHPVSRYWD